MELYIQPEWNNKHRDAHGRFMPGHKSWNKGLRRKGVIFSDTQFKKGQQPHNTKPDWYVSVRRDTKTQLLYKFIKVPGRGMVPLHRWMWELQYGTIQRGNLIVFKDGETLNCDIENLEMITRKENMARNRDREKASATMRELWKRERIRKLLELKPLTKLGHGGRKKRSIAPTMG